MFLPISFIHILIYANVQNILRYDPDRVELTLLIGQKIRDEIIRIIKVSPTVSASEIAASCKLTKAGMEMFQRKSCVGAIPIDPKEIEGRAYTNPRNPTVAKLFRFADIAENAGFGSSFSCLPRAQVQIVSEKFGNIRTKR